LASASALDDGEDVAGGQDEVLLTGVLDLGAAVLAVQDHVADLDVERDPIAVVVDAAGADGEDCALLRLLGGGVGMTMPEAVVVSTSLACTTIRSSSGLMLTLVAVMCRCLPQGF
jgi:hypothetical protein